MTSTLKPIEVLKPEFSFLKLLTQPARDLEWYLLIPTLPSSKTEI